MDYRKINIIIIVVGLLLFLKGIVDPINFRICNPDCDEFVFFIALSLSFLPVSLTLFFLRREVFVAWSKFVAIGFPIMLGGLIYAYNIEQSTGSWIGGPTEAEIASSILPSLFLLISLIIIIRAWRKGRKEKDNLPA